ncbi:hypothetical protein ACMGD3_06085 [Lysinibacillus sphaericus]|uniref:Uncharacterized protein n=1 Tax=Lysinibacillus sphaericus OT4b.31 TaxID=1285586 RepID=R7ZBZ0_LYSSH|nr:hypothetical protein [Lysinibacillus sphaericus]EON71660.1 hypothetical protein H131_14293 [Lysinibacillus sphaericus OT4b.31]
MKFLDEKILALRNEMREQEKHELAQKEAALQENEPEPQQEEQHELQAIDLYQDFVDIDGEDVPVIDQRILNGKITLRMPKLFSIMLPELASLKYPSERRPNIIYTDESTTINLAFNMTPHVLTEAGVAEFQENMIDVLEQAQPSAEWLDTDVIEINDKTIGFIEVITPAIDGDIFNLMFFASIDGQALIGTFNCMEEDLEDWRPIARAMMETLQFTPNGMNGGAQ